MGHECEMRLGVRVCVRMDTLQVRMSLQTTRAGKKKNDSNT